MARNIFKLGALEAKRAAFFLCDVQESFRPHIQYFGDVVKIANKMIESAKHLNIPVYVSEQNPKVNGRTTKYINLDGVALVYDKIAFSMYNQNLKERLKQDVPNLESVVIFGIAAHLCVEVTVIDLIHDDINVHVLADGVSSKSLMDRSLALQRMQSIGCFVGTSENVLFKLLKDNDDAAMRQISKMNIIPIPDVFGGN